jgi:hypothetical protein
MVLACQMQLLLEESAKQVHTAIFQKHSGLGGVLQATAVHGWFLQCTVDNLCSQHQQQNQEQLEQRRMEQVSCVQLCRHPECPRCAGSDHFRRGL